MICSYGNAEVGYYSGTENGLTVAGTDGYLYEFTRSGRYTRERIPTSTEKEARYLAEVSKAALYERIVDHYSGDFCAIDIEGFRDKVAELHLHAGDLIPAQWERLGRMDTEIEWNYAGLQIERAEEWMKEHSSLSASWKEHHEEMVKYRAIREKLRVVQQSEAETSTEMSATPTLVPTPINEVRAEVCRTANMLRKSAGMSRSAAMRLAWQLAKNAHFPSLDEGGGVSRVSVKKVKTQAGKHDSYVPAAEAKTVLGEPVQLEMFITGR